MNVKFADKLSATVFHNVMTQHNTEFLHYWLLRFFKGGWCDHATDFYPDTDTNALWYNQSGQLGELRIACHSRDVYRDPEFPDVLLSDHFDWSIWGVPVDNYGLPIEGVKPERILVGGLVNHGDLANPSWSSHT